MIEPGIVLEGGSIDVNGAGSLLTTESCLLNPNRNPTLSRAEIEDYLRTYLGVTNVLWLGDGIAGDDTDGHIDDLARFVAPDTIVTVVEDDPADVNYKVLAGQPRAPPRDARSETAARSKSKRSRCRPPSSTRTLACPPRTRTSTSRIARS